ncbi:MAG: hypothetical protein QM758_00675 [Armatimonas sp.]
MNRRQFLSYTLLLAGAGSLALTGCGGGGGGSETAFVTRQVTVQFPAGFSLNAADLTAEAGRAAAPLNAQGGFSVQTPESDLPSLAMIRDKDGRGVLLGFMPIDGSPLTTRSAAVALLYYALGGFMLPEASRRPLVALLEADATAVTLAGVIDRRMAANPYALEANDDAEVKAALTAAYNTLTTTGRVVRTQSFQGQLDKTRAEVEPLLLVEPSGLQSNVEVVQTTGINVIATNHSRRYCKVFVYQTGNPDPLPKAILQRTDVKLDSTNALGVFSTINNLTSGQTAYVPISTEPISLPLATGSKKTLYELIVVGAATNDIPRAFFSDAMYVDEQAKWVTAREDLTLLTWWHNLILPLFFEALGIAGIAATTGAVEGSLTAMKAIEAQSVKTLLFNASKGSLIAAAGDFWALAAESTAVGEKVRQALLPLYEAAVGQLAAETAAARAALFAKLVVRGAIAAATLLGLGDSAYVIKDVASALSADRWSVTVFQPDLILSPTSKTVAPGQRVTFSAKPPANLKGTISYVWSEDGTNTTLSSADGVVGNPITTTSTSVDLVTSPSSQGKITVKVVATLTDPNGVKSEIGTAQAVVTIDTTSVDVAVTQQLYTVSSTNPGKSYVMGGYIVPVPGGAWARGTAYINESMTAGSVDRVDYDSGAPVINTGDISNWKPYGYDRNGNGKFYNLGKGTMFLLELGSGEVDAADAAQAADAVKKGLDREPVDHVTFA